MSAKPYSLSPHVVIHTIAKEAEKNGISALIAVARYKQDVYKRQIQKNLYNPLPSHAYRFFLILPSNHFINDFLLLGRAAVQVDACGFDAFVFHKVGKERDVVELFEKVLGEVMSQ